MRQQHVTQRQNKQIMEGNEWETERFPIRQETNTQRHAIPANFSYFIAFPTLRSNRRRQRERAHTLHIDVGFLSSRLALSTITANSSIAKARTTSSSSVRSGFWFSFFFGKNLQNSPSSSATKTKGSTKHWSRQRAPRPTPTHPSFRMLRSTNQDNGRSTAKKKKKNREAERKTKKERKSN